jgi:hypothetical protein
MEWLLLVNRFFKYTLKVKTIKQFSSNFFKYNYYENKTDRMAEENITTE